jgi:hypothetical protein
MEGLLAERPDLGGYRAAVQAWAVAEAQCHLLRKYADTHGLLDESGEPLGFTRLAMQVESRAEKARAVLGLDPVSEARLAVSRAAATNLAVDLEGLAAEGRRIIAAQSVEQVSS